MRSSISAFGAFLGAAVLLAAAQPALASPPARPAVYGTAATPIIVLLDDPRTLAVLNRYLPGFSATAVARKGRRMTLRQVQPYDPGLLTNAALARVDAALARIPVVPVRTPPPQPPNGPTGIPDALLDPARSLKSSQLESALHRPLPEQYIWTRSGTAPAPLAPHYFRRSFEVSAVPAHATLYLAGPRRASIYLDGRKVGHYQLNLDFPMGIRVYECDVSGLLHAGRNVLAIEAVRGPGSGTEAEDTVSRHLRRGRVLAVMIVPAARGMQAPPVVMSDARWRASAARAPQGWQDPAFDDSAWRQVEDLGGIESSIDLFQANADAGMYAWPGYDGISPFLAHYALHAMEVSHVYAGVGTIENAQALTGGTGGGAFTVELPRRRVSLHDAPQVMLDFGREVSGRLELQSDSGAPAEVTVQYGESAAEALLQPYLGADPVYLPPHGTAYGPKSGFRYAVVRFTGGRSTRFRAIRLDGIAYPVDYEGSFESSDPQLNRMWAIGAYTAHLCMQDDIWDAPKRDRNRWMGDLDVGGLTIDDVFGDRFLMEDTLNRLLGPAPVEKHVNGIPGYSAFWVTGETAFYLHTGSMRQLASVHTRLVQLLEYMEKELNRRDLFADRTHAWPFVDWAPDMYGDTAQTRLATQLEYYAAFRDGAYLLRVLHDGKNATRMAREAASLKAAAQKYLLDAQGTFGDRWQPNAYAVLSGVANRDQYAAIWREVLSQAGKPAFSSYDISPYYNFYVVSAMAKMGHGRAALEWIRRYWGGMVQEGATSFWEGYNPTWFKGFMYHASLQADAMSGFRVSLAHEWSSGVTPWLMREVLGIRPVAGGFAEVDIRPDLLGLQWAKGGEPTPHGVLRVSIRDAGHETRIELPPDVVARVAVPVSSSAAKVRVNGRRVTSTHADGGKRAVVILSGKGRYVVRSP
jgi:alpha-L-rhamnosidase